MISLEVDSAYSLSGTGLILKVLKFYEIIFMVLNLVFNNR